MLTKSRSLEFAMAAQGATDAIEHRLLSKEGVDHDIDTAMVLGNGWDVFNVVRSIALQQIPNFTDIQSKEHRSANLCGWTTNVQTSNRAYYSHVPT